MQTHLPLIASEIINISHGKSGVISKLNQQAKVINSIL